VQNVQRSVEAVEPPEQTQLDSTVQVVLQPSPLAMSPSSQPSAPTSLPSPQIGTQFSGLAGLSWLNPDVHNSQTSAEVVEPPMHTQLVSTVEQSDAHPSPPPVSPSSQFSSPASKPSPQVGTQFSFVPS
jgi:hypothetical protein